MGNSNNRFHTLKQYNNTIDITTTTTTTTNYKSIPLINNKINNQQTSINQYHDNNNNNNSLINDNKKMNHKQNDHDHDLDLDLDLDHNLNLDLDQIDLDLTINNSLNKINYELLHKNDSFINNNNNNESLIQHYSPNRYNYVDKADHYALHSNKTNQFNLMKNKKYKKKLNLLKKIQKFYFYCINHLLKLNYHRIMETNESM